MVYDKHNEVNMKKYHYSVLKNEVLNFLVNSEILVNPPVGVIILVDATCGEGGHSEAILEKAQKEGWLNKLKLICVDADSEILERAQKRLQKFAKNIIFVNANFIDLKKELAKLKIKKIDGILLDLGISTYHYKAFGRGFSFSDQESLDMCLDKTQKLTAAKIVNNYAEQELINIFKEYGEEKWSKRIAQKIIQFRANKKIEASVELAEIVAQAVPRRYWPKHIHPATRVFQALRIVVNSELENLQKVLINSADILNPQGRILVITFHSLEDRIVKKYFKSLNFDKRDDIYGKVVEMAPFSMVVKKPVLANLIELTENPASRSAKLRVIEKR
jgi:16S rRNA (cytosine1402-N4)-methyltransferase